MNRRVYPRLLLTASLLLPSFPETALPADNASMRLGGGRIAYQYVARVTVDFTRGTGSVFGYFTQLAGVRSSSLFNGTPSEASAYLTFHANIAIRPLPGNGEIAPNTFGVLPSSVEPGPFHIYHDASPAHRWANPESFATGTLVATLQREGEQFALIGPIATNNATAKLESATSFTLDGVEVNLRRMLRNGVSNLSTANAAPLPGSTPVAPIFAFAGYGLAISE